MRYDEGSRQGVVSWMMSVKDRLTMAHHGGDLPLGQDLMVRDGMLQLYWQLVCSTQLLDKDCSEDVSSLSSGSGHIP